MVRQESAGHFWQVAVSVGTLPGCNPPAPSCRGPAASAALTPSCDALPCCPPLPVCLSACLPQVQQWPLLPAGRWGGRRGEHLHLPFSCTHAYLHASAGHCASLLGPCLQHACLLLLLLLQEPWKLTRNQDLNIMHVSNATDFLRSTQHHLVAGDTLVFGFIFFLHPVSAACACCLNAGRLPCVACLMCLGHRLCPALRHYARLPEAPPPPPPHSPAPAADRHWALV